MYETVSDALLRLALADAKAGLPVLVPVRVEVLPFLCSFADLLWHAFDRRLAVVLHVDSQCPPWWVDPDALEEALLRLVLQARADAPPIGRMFGMPMLMDESLFADDRVTFQAGTHQEAVTMSLADYRRVAMPEVAYFGKHL